MEKKCMICEKKFIITSRHHRKKSNRLTCSTHCSRIWSKIARYYYKKHRGERGKK